MSSKENNDKSKFLAAGALLLFAGLYLLLTCNCNENKCDNIKNSERYEIIPKRFNKGPVNDFYQPTEMEPVNDFYQPTEMAPVNDFYTTTIAPTEMEPVKFIEVPSVDVIEYENQFTEDYKVEPNNKIHSLEQGFVQVNNNMRTLKEQMKVQTNNLCKYEELVKNSLTEQLVQTNNNVCKMKEQIKEYINQTDSKIQELQETFIPRAEMIHYRKDTTTSDNLFG
jgi:hypothetical protein